MDTEMLQEMAASNAAQSFASSPCNITQMTLLSFLYVKFGLVNINGFGAASLSS